MIYFKTLKLAREYAKTHPGYETIWYDSNRNMYYLSCI